MLDIIKVAQESQDKYWVLLSVVIPLCYIWFLLILLARFLPQPKGKSNFIYQMLDTVYSVYLPIIGNNLFLPILALLLDAFICDH